MELSLDDIDVYTAIAVERTEEEQLVLEWQTEQLERLGVSETMA